MIEYLPWSYQELNKSIELYKHRQLSILDIELGGACNLSCVYCDTPNRASESKLDIENIRRILSTNKINWIFICGLGEPTAGPNIAKLKQILELCGEFNIACSMFTNLKDFDDSLFDYVKNNILYILFKLDTFKEDKMQDLYGIKKVGVLLEKLNTLESSINVTNSFTNVAASIVPTSKNKDEVINIVDYCLNKGVFPLIGDLEDCGMPEKIYKSLKLSEEDLLIIKKEIQTRFADNYKIPICPSVIGGIHINNSNEIVIDENTGLSCHWFWLQKPKIRKLLDFTNESSYDAIVNSIINYRNQKVDFVSEYIPKINEMSFGGCGGDVKYLLSEYLNAHKLLL